MHKTLHFLLENSREKNFEAFLQTSPPDSNTLVVSGYSAPYSFQSSHTLMTSHSKMWVCPPLTRMAA